MRAFVILAVSVFSAVALTAQSQDDLDKRFIAAWVKQPKVNLNVPAGTAKVVIVKFNDWMCPGCKVWYQMMKPVLAKYQASNPGKVKYVEKDWPWNSQCNAAVTQTFPGHEAACAAAAAVRLAADKGKRETMAEWLYANQPETPQARQMMIDRIRAKVDDLLGVKDFAPAYQAKLADIKKDIADGMAVQIQSTPTYFINGIRAVGADGSTIDLHYMELAIQHELGKK